MKLSVMIWIAFALSFHGAKALAVLDHQLIVNPGAEDGQASPGGAQVVTIPGWDTRGTNFTVDAYAPDGNVSEAEGARIGGGIAFFSGGPNNASSMALQKIDVSSLASAIDAGGVYAVMSAQMTGYGQQDDNGTIFVTFLGSDRLSRGGGLRLGPQPGNYALWQYYRSIGAVPAGTRTIQVEMYAKRAEGSFDDANFDNLSLVLTKNLPAAPQAVPAPVQTDRSAELLVNGGAEDGTASPNGSDPAAIPGWQPTGGFTVISYADPNGISAQFGQSIGGGSQVFVGGNGGDASSAAQTVDLSAYASDIDAGKLRLDMTFLIGAASGSGTVMAEELDAAGQTLFERDTTKGTGGALFLAYHRQWPLLAGVRSARITLTAPAQDNPYKKTYFDNIHLKLVDALPPVPLYPPANGPVTVSYGSQLLDDPGAEDAVPDFINYQLVAPIRGWILAGNFTAADAYNPSSVSGTEIERIGGGRNFFAGGPSTAYSTASQTVDISDYLRDVDSSLASAHLEAQLGGFGAQGDNASVVATYLDAGLHPLGTLDLLPVTGDDPLGATFSFQQTDGSVPPLTRSIEVTLVAQRLDGDYNDGYFDNLWLSLNKRAADPGTLGDVDGDGRIGPGDVILLLRSTLGLVTLTPDQIVRADMNDDGQATLADAPLILQKLVGTGRL